VLLDDEVRRLVVVEHFVAFHPPTYSVVPSNLRQTAVMPAFISDVIAAL